MPKQLANPLFPVAFLREFTDTLAPVQVYQFAVDACQPHQGFQPVDKVTATTLGPNFIVAAARIFSISETCS
jgi:hypothetical protein